jgi:hypothetical protein
MAEYSDRDFERLLALDAGPGPARAIDDARFAAIIAGALGGAGFPPPMPGSGGSGSGGGSGGAHGAKAGAHGAKAAASATAKAITAGKLTWLAGGAVTVTLATVAWVALRSPTPAAESRRPTPTSAVAITATASPNAAVSLAAEVSLNADGSPSTAAASPGADIRSPTAATAPSTAAAEISATTGIGSPTADRRSPSPDDGSPTAAAEISATTDRRLQSTDSRPPTAAATSSSGDIRSPTVATASPTSGRPTEKPPAKHSTRRRHSVVAAASPNSASGGSASTGRRAASAIPRDVDDGSATATPDDLLAEANAARAAHRWREADALYARVARGEPGGLAVQTALVAAGSLRLEHLGDPGGAAQRFRAALAGGSRAALAEDARWGLAEAARATGDAAEERRALDEFLAHHASSPRAPRARVRRAELGPRP